MAKKHMTGTVTSDKMDKTIIVRVDRRKRHPLYSKSYTISKSWAVHDEKQEAKIGDTVRIVEFKPMSKTKSWTLEAVVDHNPAAAVPTDDSPESEEIAT